jgi:site-specific DNA recombinase
MARPITTKAPTLRAVIYARYSSDRQSPESITDQISQCQRYCRDHGWEVVNTYSDAGISGASAQRPGYQSVLSDLTKGLFDVVVVDSLDRLSRNLADVGKLINELNFYRATLHTADIGKIDPLLAGILAAVGQSFLTDLAHKTRRGLEGKVDSGLSAGSIGFGYRVHPTEKGKRLIHDGEAAVVKRIFTEYAEGQSPRALAAKLNNEEVPGPKGREWGDTTIRGQIDRGTGLLNNELYIGRLVWDRCSYVKNMTTGRRQARPKDQSEWMVTEVPELRIIDDELWHRVKARQAVVHTEMRRDEDGNALCRAHRHQHLLSGLLVCGVCGSPFVVQDYYRYGCNRVRSKGNCSNTIKVPRAELEQRLTDAITSKLMDRSYFDSFIIEIRNQLKEKARTALDARKPFEKQLIETRARIRRLVTVLEETDDPDPSISDRLRALRTEERGLVSELDALSPEALIVPSEEELIEAYGRCLFYLRELADPAQNSRGPNQLIREAISRIILTPTEDRTALVAELEGSLPRRFLIDSKEKSNKKTLPAVDTTGSELSVVAGARFELTTFRL